MLRTKSLAFALAFLLALTGCRSRETTATAPRKSDRVTNREIQLFYESPQQVLVAERRTLPLPENDSAAVAPIMRELMKGPNIPVLGRLFPADTTVRAAFLLPDGYAIIDLGGPTLTSGFHTGSHNELMAVYSVVETAMANFPTVRRVRILVNGQQAETLGGHVRLDRSFYRPPAWALPANARR